MKVLVLGSGAREHAIALSLISDADVYVSPGNYGTGQCAQNIQLDITNPKRVLEFVRKEGIDLVVVGPEAVIVAGVTDLLQEEGVLVFGPSSQAGKIESSKHFAKEIMRTAGILTARSVLCSSKEEVLNALGLFAPPFVIKADGLAGGKGVIVTPQEEQAIRHALDYLPAGPVLVEEYLDGFEVSLFCFSDGARVIPMVPAQDFKRLYDDDHGPNTGGMGAYTPVPYIIDRFNSEDHFMQKVCEEIAQPLVNAMNSAGAPFVGLLYCGLIVTASGIKVVEFNSRFGDPETQVVLQRLKTPLLEPLLACARGDLSTLQLEFSKDSAVCVVLTAQGYPECVVTGGPVKGIAKASKHATVLHAATGEPPLAVYPEEGEVLDPVVTGGRVLNVVAKGNDIVQARERAYAAIGCIELDGAYYRKDIARLAAAKAAVLSSATLGSDTNPISFMYFKKEKNEDKNDGGDLLKEVDFAGVEIPGYKFYRQGKVRTLFESLDGKNCLIVASDRVSAFDRILEPILPKKGEILTRISRMWFQKIAKEIDIRVHIDEEEGWEKAIPEEIQNRTMKVKKLQMYPIECVVRGYLCGSVLKEYQERGTVCDMPVSPGLVLGSKFSHTMFTPSFKKDIGDVNITFTGAMGIVGEDTANTLCDLSLKIYAYASRLLEKVGLILADTKFEFGIDESGTVHLADEVLTPDSSRYWDMEEYTKAFAEGRLPQGYDKQIVRNWLKSTWDGVSPIPPLSQPLLADLIEKYELLCEKLRKVLL